MRRDLDRLAWLWMVLGVLTALVDLAGVIAFVRAGTWELLVDLVVAAPLPGWAPELLLLLAVALLAASVAVPAVGFTLVGLGLLDRRGWAMIATLIMCVLAVFSSPPLGLLVVAYTLWTLADRGVRSRLGAEGEVGFRLAAIGRLNRTAVTEVHADPGERVAFDALGGGATTVWSGAQRVSIVGSDGRQYLVEPRRPLRLAAGPSVVDVELVPEVAVRRFAWFGVLGSVVWLTIFLAMSLVAEQSTMMWERIACPVFGVQCPPPPSTGGNPGQQLTAEYLARLLKKDYSGAEEGVIEKKIEHDRAQKKADRFYLPAGSKGPVTHMGGSADTAPEPVRSAQADEVPVKPKQRRPRQTEIDRHGAAPTPEAAKPDKDDGTADADHDSPIDSKEQPRDLAPQAEEKEGWGVQDWYDEEDAHLDKLEIETMIRLAKTRLKIDPNDPGALSILSYYQYLAEDYGSAEKTYDKYIEILPEDAAGYNNKALVYKRRGEYQKEEGLYRVALALEPDDPTALNNLAVNLAHQKRYDEALAIMKRLEVLDPGDPYADLHRSKIYAAMGNDEQAYSYLDKALRGMQALDTLHHIEFRQDIRVDPAFEHLRQTARFRSILLKYYGKDTPLPEE